ncbi:Na(+)/H(+) exchange regulatory cofactor NHE-RF1 isoform X2 [Gracilinanus agilis]|uniref:Na(+)/H(+) exchange regulatory cofactor NHE-RF1 isoform X2 n=1 Tax=Gracilinanus agilis TaxID=191870 RepID=UPI001CFF2AEB|nr:Na(+)/H(+) exchange regulatory cofactor NHE-RF1 isoform X2 [Gracilinanus agilis]
MSADGTSEGPLPRLCNLEKGPNGYGFHLHGEKGKVGQFIRLVEPGSPAEKAGLLAGDRLVEVNGENVEQESHQQVVSRIRAALNSVRLLVVDPEADERLQKLGVQVREELLRGQPGEVPAEPTPKRAEVEVLGNQNEETEANRYDPEQRELRPRLCAMKKGPSGYGFNLHSDKSKPGQYIRAVDPNSPAEASGLQAQDRIVEVNGVCMEGKQHGDVVAAIKAGGEETKLLVVDKETDEFFKKCKVIPSQEHLNGPLPEPVANGEVEKESNSASWSEAVCECPKPASSRSTLSDTSDEVDSQDSPKKRDSTPPSSTSSSSDPILDFNISLAVAKERAHQKRSSKRAPQMDWSKKNELFSNL